MRKRRRSPRSSCKPPRQPSWQPPGPLLPRQHLKRGEPPLPVYGHGASVELPVAGHDHGRAAEPLLVEGGPHAAPSGQVGPSASLPHPCGGLPTTAAASSDGTPVHAAARAKEPHAATGAAPTDAAPAVGNAAETGESAPSMGDIVARKVHRNQGLTITETAEWLGMDRGTVSKNLVEVPMGERPKLSPGAIPARRVGSARRILPCDVEGGRCARGDTAEGAGSQPAAREEGADTKRDDATDYAQALERLRRDGR